MKKCISRRKLILNIIAITFIGIFLIYQPKVFNGKNLPITDSKDRLELIKERKVMNVVISDNNYPFSYIDPETNELTGINGDIIKEIARRLGLERVEVKKIVPFEDLLTELNNNKEIDVMSDRMYAIEERKKIALFTDILYKEWEVVVIPKFSKITVKEDLKNAVVGAQEGTVFLDLANKWKEQKLIKDVVVFDNQANLMSAINTLKVDAGITDSILVSYLISNNPKLYLKTLYPYEPELPGLIASAVRKNDVSLANAINKEIDGMKKDKTLLKILESYGLNQENFVPADNPIT
ncbi:ABC transporter substrate-binding protein [Clostridium cellulovorans]|uniref:Extracellular solute-binding protein family 3 n=1 Tax=Clostridium cellulovorans (strain ATCC 35296 / DSM 3052 / OCM 3 / 743B) TaxID=573061 RepID=D9SSX8_CLOC7|nr:ABC transporter substrate-binding protein [Clostridium cellulovorans]ADL52640.1 extracellular solute-binding protein family 3 [Clostridium cellulovorans 743B]